MCLHPPPVDSQRSRPRAQAQIYSDGEQMPQISHACVIALLSCAAGTAVAASRPPWPPTLPVYDHIVIVVEENKDFEQILGGGFDAPYIRKLASEGAIFERMFAEEHYSQGNYFWLFSGSNQNVGFRDQVPSKANHPDYPFKASSLGEQLIAKGLSFKGYSESLPGIGSTVDFDPPNCRTDQCVYARKHVPWISFANVPNGTTIDTSSNLRFADFPGYATLPTVAFVIPNLNHDMHNGKPAQSIPAGDAWLQQNLDGYYQWAKTHNSLLIVTFDENDDQGGYYGLTNPLIGPTRDIRRATTGCYAIFRIGSSQSPPEHISSQAHMPRAKASPT